MICLTCKKDLDLENFYLRKDSNKYRTNCKICLSYKNGNKSNREQIRNEILMIKKKKCSKCKKLLTLDQFYLDKSNKHGYRSSCINCISVQNTNRQKVKDQLLIKKYGITREEFNKMLENQNYCCKICSDYLHKPLVDHCHQTGKVRGLLCINCNFGIGNFRDNKDLLQKAIKYLSL